MTLRAGTKLGVYEVVGSLGAGGMGEVYRAHDPRLGRDVAIKVLPADLVENPERRARFEREARVLASINHPHIGAIYGIEDADGYRALVLELIQGQTLAARIDAIGRLPVDDALMIARQIAEALEAAHEKGIVHRDLKPANIMLNEAGAVKVLDFGLARLDAAEASGSSLANSPTLTYAGTAEGIILGTAVYLSPEQARGRPVDKRTDIWAFGCVLFEMLTGGRVFGRETLTDTIAAIVGQEPDWKALPQELPERIERLIRRCLAKDLRRRLHDIADARIEIEEVLAAPTGASQRAESMPRAAGQASFQKLPWILLALAILGLGAASVIALNNRRVVPSVPGEAITFTMSPPGPVNFTPNGNFVSVSPDGRYIAFVANNANGLPMVWLRSKDAVDMRPVAGTENARSTFWSPDSRYLGVFSAGGYITKVPIDGGPPQPLATAISTSTGGTWNREGVILFSSMQGPIRRIPATGGAAPIDVTDIVGDQVSRHESPSFLPDGKRFVFFARGPDPSGDGIYVGSLDGGSARLVVRASSAVSYVQPGYLMYVREGILVAQPFDPVKAEITGDPTPIAERVDNFPESGMAAFSVSDSGVLVYRSSPEASSNRLLWLDRSGKRVGEVGEPGSYRNPRLSPDGKRIAVEITDSSGNRDIWILDAVSGTRLRFTFDPGRDASPVWSSNGQFIVWQGSNGVYIKSSDGKGTPERIREEPWIPDEWLPDGSGLLFHPPAPRQVFSITWPGSDRTERKVLEGQGITTHARVTRDGKWIAFATTHTGRFEVMIQDFPQPSGRWQVSSAGGVQPKWRADGKELFYLTLDARLAAVPVTLGALVHIGKPQILFQTNAEVVMGMVWHQYDVTPDGQRFLVNTGNVVNTPVTVVHNWPALLRNRR
jgi:serine/threonine protein kinase/Tol biopolymer transport system component